MDLHDLVHFNVERERERGREKMWINVGKIELKILH